MRCLTSTSWSARTSRRGTRPTRPPGETSSGEVWADDGRYIDPLADVAGHDQIDAVIGAVQAQFPGLQFRLAGPVDAHHDQARFTWEPGLEGDYAVVVLGFDVAKRDADGRLALVLGFLDKVPSP